MDAPVALTIELPGPLDVAASLAPLGRWGDDGLDRWDGLRLLRVAEVDGRAVAYRAVPAGTGEQPQLEVRAAADACSLDRLAQAIRGTFLASRAAALAELSQRDDGVAGLARRYPGLVPVLVPDPLTALIRSISAQQVNLPWAAAVRLRIARRYGRTHTLDDEVVYSLAAEPLAQASAAELRELQLTGAKSRAVVACARAATEGRLERAELEQLEDEQLIERLVQLPGIGHWSAEWFLARTLGRPRVVAGDLGVRKAIARLYDTGGLPSEAEVRRLTAHWGAGASLAQALALHDLAERPDRPARSVSAALSAPAPRGDRSCRP